METVPTTTSTPVYKHIDPATIHRLYHEDQMTIKAIAELCGICSATVRRYLGPVGRGRRRKVEQVAAPTVMLPEVVAAVEVRPKRLVQTKTEFKGTSATFEADHEAGTLLVRGDTFELLMNRDEIEQFIWELVEAYEFIPRAATT